MRLDLDNPFVIETWRRAANDAKTKGGGYNYVPDILRLVGTLADDTQNIKINLREIDGNWINSNFEIRLGQNDRFYPFAMGVYVVNCAAANLGKVEPQSYPNPDALDVATATDLGMVWYIGRLTYQINQAEILPGYPLMPHYEIPDQQQGAIQAAVSGSPNDTYSNAHSGYPQDYGMRILAPWRLILDGNNTQKFNLNLGAGGTVAPGSNNHYVVLQLIGAKLPSFFA